MSSEDDSWYKCVICTETFSFERKDVAMRTPILGSCGDSFCELCLVKRHASQADSRKKYIECFVCKEKKAFHIDKLTPNKGLCNAIEIFMRTSANASAGNNTTHQNAGRAGKAEGQDNGASNGQASEDIKASSTTNVSNIREDIQGTEHEQIKPESNQENDGLKEDESTKEEQASNNIPMSNHDAEQKDEQTSILNDGLLSPSSSASTRSPTKATNNINGSQAQTSQNDQSALKADVQSSLLGPKAEPAENEKSVTAVPYASIEPSHSSSIASVPEKEGTTSPNNERQERNMKKRKARATEEALPRFDNGTQIRKHFPGHGTFIGTVAGFDERKSIYQIKYDDGDKEQMTFEQVLRYHNIYDRHAKKHTAKEASNFGLVGSRIVKHFTGHGEFHGEVVSYDPLTSYYRVSYSDGDKEDMTSEQVKECMVEDNGKMAEEDTLNEHADSTDIYEDSYPKKPLGISCDGDRNIPNRKRKTNDSSSKGTAKRKATTFKERASSTNKDSVFANAQGLSLERTRLFANGLQHSVSRRNKQENRFSPRNETGKDLKSPFIVTHDRIIPNRKRKTNDFSSKGTAKRKSTTFKDHASSANKNSVFANAQSLSLERTRLFANGLQHSVSKRNKQENRFLPRNETGKDLKSPFIVTPDRRQKKIQNELDQRKLLQSECGIEIGKTMIRKHFPGHGDYNGKIINFDSYEGLYRVKYDDGDEEQMTIDEVRRHATVYGVYQKRRYQRIARSKSPNQSTKGATEYINPQAAMAATEVDGGDDALKEEEEYPEKMPGVGETEHKLGFLHERASPVEGPEDLSLVAAGKRHTEGFYDSGPSIRSEIDESNLPQLWLKDSFCKSSAEGSGNLDTVDKEPQSNNSSEDAMVCTTIVQTSSAAGSSVRIPVEDNSSSDTGIPPIIKKELNDYVKRDIKTDRMYGDRVLLARQAKNGMLKLGGGNCCMDMYPSLKNLFHPRFRELSFTYAIAYCDSWQPDGPKYAGQKYAHVDYLSPYKYKPFSVFMKRTMKTKLLGWEYCGEYIAEDPEDEIETWVRAHTVTPHDRKVIVQSLLTTVGGRYRIQGWREKLTKLLEKDASPASMAPDWLREGRRPTAAETEREERIVPLAARARALGFEENLSEEKLASLLLYLDEFRTSKPIRFVRYDEKVYNYVKDGETTKNALGKKRGNGEVCAKASDWYAYWDQQVR